MGNNIKKINAKYIYPENHKLEQVSGAFGSINGSGELVAVFFHEHLSLPNNANILIDENGVGVDNYEFDDSIVRDVKATFTMQYETLVRIRDWMNGHIETYEKSKNINTK